MVTFYDEIRRQPDALREFVQYAFAEDGLHDKIRSLAAQRPITQIMFTGMGSSYYAGKAGCYYLRQRGFPCAVMESDELSAFGTPSLNDGTLLVLISQSGESAEVIGLCKRLPPGVRTAVISNYPDRALFKYGDVKIEIKAGPEIRTATKSYTNTLAAVAFFAVSLAAGDLAGLKKDLLLCADSMEDMLENNDGWLPKLSGFLSRHSCVVLAASGASYATAGHLELVIEEAAKKYSSRYTFAQFIHGPIELISPDFACIAFDFDEKFRGKADSVYSWMTENGGDLVVITNRKDKISGAETVYIPCENPLVSPIAEVVPVELAVNAYGTGAGLRPGEIERIKKWSGII